MQVLSQPEGGGRRHASPENAPRSAGPVVTGLLISALYVLLFSNMENVAQVVQVLAVALVALAAVLAAISGVKSRGPTAFELVIILACFASFVVSFFQAGQYNTGELTSILIYSISLTVVVFSSMVITRSMPLDDFLRIAAVAFSMMAFTVLVFHSEEIASALAPNADKRWSLRARAFGLHPNLEGLMFSGGALLCIRQMVISKILGRFVYGAAALLSVAIVLSASARGGLLALMLSLAFTMPFALPKLNVYAKISILFGFIVAICGIFIFVEPIFKYLWDILELGSSTRGIDTGGTGRTDLWEQGISLIFSSVSQFFLGGGLRSSTADIIGFSTENSYITIILDSGILIGTAIIVTIWMSVLKSYGWVRVLRRYPLPAAFYSAILMFAVLQAFVNRYLLAIGNPFSLVCFFLYSWRYLPQKMPFIR